MTGPGRNVNLGNTDEIDYVRLLYLKFTTETVMSRCILNRSLIFATSFLLTSAVLLSIVNAESISGQANFADPTILNPGSVFSTITIMESGIIEDISVTIEGIEHTNVGDLIAELRFLGDDPGGGTVPAYLFFRANVDGTKLPGSLSNLDGDYTFTTNDADRDFWSETAGASDDQIVDGTLPFFASDENGDFHDLAADFFGGLNAQGQWQLIITDANGSGNPNLTGSVQGWTLNFEVSAIPEPGSAVILVVATCATVVRRRRK